MDEKNEKNLASARRGAFTSVLLLRPFLPPARKVSCDVKAASDPVTPALAFSSGSAFREARRGQRTGTVDEI